MGEIETLNFASHDGMRHEADSARSSMQLTDTERQVLAGNFGPDGLRMAMEIVVEAALFLGADSLVEIKSGHIDGCLYHGEAGLLFCERLVEQGARVNVTATTNVGALNLLKPEQCRLSPTDRKMAYRQMLAYEKLGCVPSWTCAPYQAGAQPQCGDQVAWGESNAVAFVNSALGARTNRYGDFLDIACAISGRAPNYGLHRPENRAAQLVIDLSHLSPDLKQQDAFFPVLGALIGREAGEAVSAVLGLSRVVTEDQLKAMCAGAASTGAVALIHVVGVTPEAPTLEAVLLGKKPVRRISVTGPMISDARDRLCLAQDGPIDSVALGSPHFSLAECRALGELAQGRRFRVPVYLCIGRHTFAALQNDGTSTALEALGVVLVVDTCVVVTPILPEKPGVMMTNSAKFAHYAMGNTGHVPVFGSLSECVVSAQNGYVIRDPSGWQ